MSSWLEILTLLIASLPALLLGVAWMIHTNVPAFIPLQNVAAATIGLTVAVVATRRHVSNSGGLTLTTVLILLLLATLLDHGMNGVHRWLRAGPVRVHVASVVLPLILVELDRAFRRRDLRAALAAMFVVMTALVIQPDASEATSFAGASIVLLVMYLRRHGAAIGGIAGVLGLAGASLLRPDPLAPVPYVEEIAVRIARQGPAWQAMVIIVLLLLLVPFALPTVSRVAGAAIAIYFGLLIAASFWGVFPVPVLGYGTSPIIGYFAGWAWLRATSHELKRFTPC